MKCTLDRDINECAYFDKITLKCGNSNNCSFQEDDINIMTNGGYKRTEKWFEKYYK